jgi:hypothetical protein
MTPEALGVGANARKVAARLDDARQEPPGAPAAGSTPWSYATLQPAGGISPTGSTAPAYVLPKGALRVWETRRLCRGLCVGTAGTVTGDGRRDAPGGVDAMAPARFNLSFVRDAQGRGPGAGARPRRWPTSWPRADLFRPSPANQARSDALIKLAAEKLAEAIGVDAMQEGRLDRQYPRGPPGRARSPGPCRSHRPSAIKGEGGPFIPPHPPDPPILRAHGLGARGSTIRFNAGEAGAGGLGGQRPAGPRPRRGPGPQFPRPGRRRRWPGGPGSGTPGPARTRTPPKAGRSPS